MAITDAANNDTIHVEASPNGYGNAIVSNKRLVIIGPGYNLGPAVTENNGLQMNTNEAMVNLITFDTGSDSSIVTGVFFISSGGGLHGVLFLAVNGIILRGNSFSGCSISFGGGTGTTASNILIAGNYLHTTGISNTSEDQFLTKVTIRNNYSDAIISLNDAGDVVTNLMITNNTFNYNGTHAIHDATVAYNIFRKGSFTDLNNNSHDNLYDASTPIPGVNNNAIGTWSGPAPAVFPATGSDDGIWNINAGTTYDEAGSTPRGMYSGAAPYRLSGIPGIPAIYALGSTVNTVPGGTVQVTLSTRSNP